MNSSPYRSADPLGPFISEFVVAGAQQKVRIGVGLFSALICIDCIWLAFIHAPGPLNPTLVIVMSIIAAVFGWLAFDAFREYFRARRQRVSCHEHGLRVHHGNRHEDIRYDDIASIGGVVWEAEKNQDMQGSVLWIDDDRGHRIALPTPMREPYEVGGIIRRTTFLKRLERVTQRISKGEDVRFGPCEVNATHVAVGKHVIHRGVLEKATLSGRWLSIKPRGQRDMIALTENVPDVDVLLAILAQPVLNSTTM